MPRDSVCKKLSLINSFRKNVEPLLKAMGCNWIIRKLALLFYKDPEKMNLVTEITKINENTFKSRSWSNNGRVTNEYLVEKGKPARFKFGGLKDAEVSSSRDPRTAWSADQSVRVQLFIENSIFLSAFDTCWGLEWKYGIQIQLHHSDRQRISSRYSRNCQKPDDRDHLVGREANNYNLCPCRYDNRTLAEILTLCIYLKHLSAVFASDKEINRKLFIPF